MALRKNDIIEIEITGITAQGSGVGRYEGMCVFVPSTACGDVVSAHILKVTKNVAYAKVKQILSPGAQRIQPDCSVFNMCGGCVYRHISYAEECRIKQERVEDAFKRIAHLDVPINPIFGAPETNHYRNKAQFPVGMENGALKIGFYAPHSHRIIDHRMCMLQPEIFAAIADVCRNWILTNNISCYDEVKKKGLLRHIYLRQAQATGEIMVCLVVNASEIPFKDELVSRITQNFPDVKSIVLNINREDTNVILGKKCKLLWGQDFITDILCGCKFRISPQSFYQVNRTQAERLYGIAADYAALSGQEILLDLYCGAGTIGLTMASKVKKLVGVEIIPQAVEDAKENARLNNIENAEFMCADAATAAAELARKKMLPDVVVLDPPRKGCDKELIQTVVEMNPKRIVYVSCDPATLARDLAIFHEYSYDVRQTTPVDLFPRTAHVETVCLLSRKENQNEEKRIQNGR